jgi:4-amino-4-deoxy-L-arabinose transferase-like glycosyltransferase
VTAGVVAALGLYAALAVTSMQHKSGTFDEAIHLPPGYMALALNDHRMNPDHPPFLRRLAALPLLGLPVHYRTDDQAWRSRRPWEFGRRFLYRWNDADALLGRSRLVIVGLGAVLALAVFWWTRRQFGGPAGWIALGLAVLSPDLLAHGQVVTNDLAVTAFMFLAVAGVERLTERVTATRLAFTALVTGCALATKYSAVGLALFAGVPAAVVALSRHPLSLDLADRGSGRLVTTRLGRLATLGALALAIATLAVPVIWASYGFQSATSPEPDVDAAFDRRTVRPESPVVAAVARTVERAGLLPEAYTYGFLRFLAHTESRPAFLLGERSETGWWYYFPVTLALKTPLPLLALVPVAVAVAVRRPGPLRTESFLWLPPLLYLAISMTRGINIGHRHLLPVYPFLFAAAGRAAAAALAGGRAARALLAALLAWYAVGTLRVHPHYLAYFNELAGGPQNGYQLLVDSSLDWGQDLPALKEYLDRNGITRVKLSYFGTADPQYYGIDADLLPSYMTFPRVVREVVPGDIVAVSATNLQGVYLDAEMQPLMERLRKLPPLAVIGHSIFVYRVDFAWSPS